MVKAARRRAIMAKRPRAHKRETGGRRARCSDADSLDDHRAVASNQSDERPGRFSRNTNHTRPTLDKKGLQLLAGAVPGRRQNKDTNAHTEQCSRDVRLMPEITVPSDQKQIPCFRECSEKLHVIHAARENIGKRANFQPFRQQTHDNGFTGKVLVEHENRFRLRCAPWRCGSLHRRLQRPDYSPGRAIPVDLRPQNARRSRRH